MMERKYFDVVVSENDPRKYRFLERMSYGATAKKLCINKNEARKQPTYISQTGVARQMRENTKAPHSSNYPELEVTRI